MVRNMPRPLRSLTLAVALAGTVWAADTAWAEEGLVRHVPPAGAQAGTPLELGADVAPTTSTLTLHYRTRGTTGEFAKIDLQRTGDTRWIVVVPAVGVVAPGLDYYLTAGDATVFASPEWPHTIEVTVPDAIDRRAHDLVRNLGRRSRIHTSGEWVNFGTRTVDDVKLVDRYYRIDADFAYRLWAYPLEELRVGYTRLVGDTAAPMCPSSTPCTAEAGYKVAGWFELGVAPVEGLRLDLRAAVMATAAGFAVGGRIESRLGPLDGSHVAIGLEYMADVGAAGYFRLGWGTVPGLPMAATVEITNLPATASATGVRLYYDLAHEVGGGVRVGVRVGYAARNQLVAGFTGGTNLTVDF